MKLLSGDENGIILIKGNAYEEAIVGSLIHKTDTAIQITGIKSVVVAGGVGANQKLRQKMKLKLAEKDAQVTYPRIEFCTDNAAMIAWACLQQYKKKLKPDLYFNANPRWNLGKKIIL